MLVIALVVNCLIVFPLSLALLRDAPQMAPVYGAQTDARRILACLYLSIGFLSISALSLLVMISQHAALEIARPLFALQIIYKIGTLFAVGWQSPVVKTNVAVSVLLGAALIVTGAT
ncbi:hypothetical protein [Thalassococcus sp. S3]|uniref:hypothetical protein n=1 Tax=Thalassococcus sp. S3 TaxID=2017482 RepID=UPI001023FAA9|nr:hypothetical protein [Thalassococcus sp. S3]QBF33512.1 hypothetical protein CFI11_20190 [Thalassococcus sp. S3]